MEELREMFNQLSEEDRAVLTGLVAGFLSTDFYGFDGFIAMYSALTVEHQRLLGRCIDGLLIEKG